MKTPTDPRGALIELMDKPVHINYIEIKQGFARGGHSHSYSEYFLVVQGEVEFFTLKDFRGKRVITGEVIRTIPKEPHSIYNPTETTAILLEIRKGGIKFKAEPDARLRMWVNWINSYGPVKTKKKSTIMGRRK